LVPRKAASSNEKHPERVEGGGNIHLNRPRKWRYITGEKKKKWGPEERKKNHQSIEEQTTGDPTNRYLGANGIYGNQYSTTV